MKYIVPLLQKCGSTWNLYYLTAALNVVPKVGEFRSSVFWNHRQESPDR